jgi:NADH:ubiquinone oxidoreductase subunit 3 (subunit A)
MELSEYFILIFFLVLGAGVAAGAMIVGKLLGYKSRDTKNKFAPYECGMQTVGSARIQFKVGYYLFALLFLVFDVEALFLFPVLLEFGSVVAGKTSLAPVLVALDLVVFLAILVSGLAYAWKKGILKWE